MRALAGFIIETCAGQSAGIGGFVTYGFGTAQNYVANSNNTLVEDMLRQACKYVTICNVTRLIE